MIIASDHVIYASFLRITSVNVNKWAENCDFYTFTKEILNGKLLFFCRVTSHLLISISHLSSYNG